MILAVVLGGAAICSAEVLRYHTLVVDAQDKILPWYAPAGKAFDNYLDKCWQWAVAAPNDTHGLPISFLYCAWRPGNPPTADTGWENDVGEKIPNWVESARLYYQYSGDKSALDYVKRLVDYSLDHGQTPTNHVWPAFPVGTSNAGDTEFRGFTGVWSLWDCHVDLAADIGWAMYRMYQLYGDTKYRDKAIHVANVLVTNMVAGTATDSPWPYVINSLTGSNQSRYAASWDGALSLFDLLIANNHGNVADYSTARTTLKNWLLTYPMQNGAWVDGHSDVKIQGTNNLSTTCASDMCLYLFDNPSWDPNFQTNALKLIKWTEDNFVNPATPDGLPGQYHGAYVPAEQTAYPYRMGYQAARLGAQYAQWYAVSGDATYKDRAYRCFAYNTYMMQADGQSSDGPTDTVGFWWSDCYGEATRMYYYGLAAVPEWAPADENHCVYSSSVVTNITYTTTAIAYRTFDNIATQVFRLAATPTNVVGGTWNFSSGVLRVYQTTNPVFIALDPSTVPPSLALNVTGSTTAPGYLTLTTDVAGAITNVEFYVGTTRLGEDNAAPFSFLWTNIPVGSYSLTARAAGITSTPVAVTITARGGAPVLGNTSEGTTTDYITDGSGAWINACRFQASASQTLTAIKAKVHAITGKYQCAIYADNAGNATNLLRTTSEVTPTTNGWWTFPLTSPLAVTNGQYYWLAIWSNDTAARVYADNGGTVRFGLYPYGAWPNPVNLSGSGGFTYCLYATGPAPTVFDNWKSNYGLPSDTPATADLDDNGLPVLLEYALGLDPLSGSFAGAPVGAVNGDCLTLTYTRLKAATDLTVTAEVTGSVAGGWSSASSDVDQFWQVTDGLTLQTITARDKTPVNSATSRFIRLKVSQP